MRGVVERVMERNPWRARPLLALVVAMGAVIPAPARAQSLGDAARQEKEKRAKTAKPVKVYTDADLEAMRASRPATRAPDPVPKDAKAGSADPRAKASGAEPAEDETAERKRLEAEWRIRFADARRKISEAEVRCWHSVVRTVFVAGIPVQQWVKEFEESEELRQAKKALVDLEEEFRKTGLPPGWTRE
jgi:hypothetical protein